MLRLFAAVAVPEDLGEALARRQKGVQGARWRPPESLHITLRFFGDVPENVADDIDSALSVVSGEPLTLELSGVGTFGEGADVHVLWAGVAENPALRRLAKAVETAARRAGLKPESRAYKPHVTLAYLRRADPAEVAAWVQTHNLLRSPPFVARAFGLYSSWRTDEGSAYRLEQAYSL
jgi:RNA 2',3'-cyclic 3'-phosphodiesterase